MISFKKTIFPILLATAWISLSEFVRNELLLKSYWIDHYQKLGLVFPSEPINGAVWGLWSLLFAIAELKDKFLVKVKDVMVFNQNLFIQFLEQKNYLNDSYTQYKNKVGLTIDGKYLKQRNEVALVWPFKDCILEGGQSREEDKREEIFFNEVLAQDEITQLLEPKVLTNAKRIDKD